MNVILFGKRVFVDVIKLSILEMNYPRLPWWVLMINTLSETKEKTQIKREYKIKITMIGHKPRNADGTRTWKKQRRVFL